MNGSLQMAILNNSWSNWQKKAICSLLLAVALMGVTISIFLGQGQREMNQHGIDQLERKDHVLSLSIKPTRISQDDFLRGGNLKASVFFTNNSRNALEFITNG